jgi:hypothetical protein
MHCCVSPTEWLRERPAMLRSTYIASLVKDAIYVYPVSQTKPINAFFAKILSY